MLDTDAFQMDHQYYQELINSKLADNGQQTYQEQLEMKQEMGEIDAKEEL